MSVEKQINEVDTITVKFAGDSGDGIQLTGDQFGNTTAIAGNDFATFPDFPSEIRAPLGTTYGVSSYQIQFAAKDIYTPGDTPEVLVCFNPAALKVNIGIVNKGGFDLSIDGSAGEAYYLEYSKDLNDWSGMTKVVIPESGIAIIELGSPVESRYFRVLYME